MYKIKASFVLKRQVLVENKMLTRSLVNMSGDTGILAEHNSKNSVNVSFLLMCLHIKLGKTSRLQVKAKENTHGNIGIG